MLMYHTDSLCDRIEGIGDLYLLPLDIDPALLAVFMSKENLHQSRLPCTVLTDQCMDLSLIYGKRHILIRHKSIRIDFRYAFHSKKFFWHSFLHSKASRFRQSVFYLTNSASGLSLYCAKSLYSGKSK